MEGQINLFDIIKPPIMPGDWVETHGKRVMFDDLIPGRLYVEDASTQAHTWCRVVRITRKAGDAVWMTDGTRTANQGHMLTRKYVVDADPRPAPEMYKDLWLCGKNGWFYEVE